MKYLNETMNVGKNLMRCLDELRI